MKRFVPLFEQFQHDETFAAIVKSIADAIDATGKFTTVKIQEGNAIYLEHSYLKDDERHYYRDKRVNVYATYKAVLKPVKSEDSDSIRLFDIGLANLREIIPAFEWATEFNLDSNDCPLDYKDGDISDVSPEDTVDWNDIGSEPDADLAQIGKDLAEFVFLSWDEYAYMLDIQKILDEQVPEEDDEEDYEDEEDEDLYESNHEHGDDGKFIQWACEQLSIKQCPKIEFGDDHNNAVAMRSMAFFHPAEYRIYVLRGKRLKADYYRSLAHELVHAHQFERGEDLDGSTGSPHENEANSRAGELLRDYGKMDHTIYEG